MGLWIKLAVGGALFIAALIASGDAVIYKREPRSATLWVIVIWLLPVAGPVLYFVLGINHVRRRAAALRGDMVRHRTKPADGTCELKDIFPAVEAISLAPLERLVGEVVGRPLLSGNTVEPLVDGSQAYPAMLEAIDSASQSIALATYIFDAEGIGERFVEALARAKKRGVEVRVLIDTVGADYSWPPVSRSLREHDLPVGHFNPRMLRLPAINLRNHRKILVVDGKIGFTGGLNIKHEYWQPEAVASQAHDLHFRVRGPAVAHFNEVFADDWQFTTGEALRGEKWFPPLTADAGATVVRGVESGPDENFDRIRWVIIGALNAARRTVRIMTPYFLPDAAILSALNAAALRGVEVDILLPEKSNLTYVQWATFGQLSQVLECGCHVRLACGSFDHSKLMLVDGWWTFLGSANWDARSLRLNFEFNVECYSAELGLRLEQMMQARLAKARPISLADLAARALPIKLRDGLARLFVPYL